MTTRRIAWTLALATALGLLVAIPLGEDQRLSVELWLAGAGAWLAYTVISVLIGLNPLVRGNGGRRWPRWLRLRRRDTAPRDGRPRSLRSLDVMVATACDPERGHGTRLGRRLAELTDDEPATRERLGDTAWLMEADRLDRPPTVAEIDTFLDRLLAEQP